MAIETVLSQKKVRNPRKLEAILEAYAASVNAVPVCTVTGADQEDGTNDVTVQVVDQNGAALAGRFKLHVWIGSASMGAPVDTGITAFTTTTGTELDEEVDLADYLIITDANGVAAFTVTAADGTRHCMAEVAGKIVSGSVVITGN